MRKSLPHLVPKLIIEKSIKIITWETLLLLITKNYSNSKNINCYYYYYEIAEPYYYY